MKTKLKLKCFLLLASLSVPALGHAQGTFFTYQGHLADQGSPANGRYDLRFSLYDSSAGGLQLGNNITRTADVSNGLFTADMNFGTNFTGAQRWLQLEVRTNGGGVFTPLSSRQEITPTPYAIYAGKAALANTAANVASGAVVASLNGLKDAVTLQAGSNVTITPSGNSLTIASAGVGGSGIWSVLNNNTYYNAGNVGIGTTTPSTYGHGGTARLLEINNSGTTMHSQSHLMLYTGVNSLMDSAMGSITWAQPGGMAAYIGAQTRSTTPNAPSATLTFGTRQAGDGGPSPRMVITEAGNVGIGTIVPTAGYRLEVDGATILRPGNGSVQFGSPSGELGLSLTPTLGNRADLRFDGSTLKLLASTGVGPPSSLNGIAISTSGKVGIGTVTPAGALQVASGGLAVTGASSPYSGAGAGVFLESGGAGGNLFAYNYSAGTPRTLVLNSPGGNVGIGAASTARLNVEGSGGGYTSAAIRAVNTPGLAGEFVGRVTVSESLVVSSSISVGGSVSISGNLSKGSGSFKIDHPLDPANKYLYHSFVESPDMMNVYNGNITLDAVGEAVVELPEWFESLNKDFRYQLTAIGAPGPNLYVAEEVTDNHFKIAGGSAGAKVSWQITGVRQDAFANAHRIQVEEEKTGRERGSYLHPELFGQPAAKIVLKGQQ